MTQFTYETILNQEFYYSTSLSAANAVLSSTGMTPHILGVGGELKEKSYYSNDYGPQHTVWGYNSPRRASRSSSVDVIEGRPEGIFYGGQYYWRPDVSDERKTTLICSKNLERSYKTWEAFEADVRLVAKDMPIDWQDILDTLGYKLSYTKDVIFHIPTREYLSNMKGIGTVYLIRTGKLFYRDGRAVEETEWRASWRAPGDLIRVATCKRTGTSNGPVWRIWRNDVHENALESWDIPLEE